jgi:hypothetical protein
MREVKIDRVYLLNCDGIAHAIYHINDLEDAKQRAKYLNEKNGNGYNYYVKIINEYVNNEGWGYQRKQGGL